MRTCQRFFGIARIILSALVTALTFRCVAGCSDTYSSGVNRPAIARHSGQSASADTESNFAGVWQGIMLASCGAVAYLPSRCDALQKVTITLLEDSDAKLRGRYTPPMETGSVITATIPAR